MTTASIQTIAGLPAQFKKPLPEKKCSSEKFRDLFVEYFKTIHNAFHKIYEAPRVNKTRYQFPPCFETQNPYQFEKTMIAQGKRGLVAYTNPENPYAVLPMRILLNSDVSATEGLLQLCSQEHFNPMNAPHAILLATYLTLARIWGKKRFDAYFSGERRLALDPNLTRTPLMHIYQKAFDLPSFLRLQEKLSPEKGVMTMIGSKQNPKMHTEAVHLGKEQYLVFIEKESPQTKNDLIRNIKARLGQSAREKLTKRDYRDITFAEKQMGLSFEDIMKVRRVAADQIQSEFPIDPISTVSTREQGRFPGYFTLTTGERVAYAAEALIVD